MSVSFNKENVSTFQLSAQDSPGIAFCPFFLPQNPCASLSLPSLVPTRAEENGGRCGSGGARETKGEGASDTPDTFMPLVRSCNAQNEALVSEPALNYMSCSRPLLNTKQRLFPRQGSQASLQHVCGREIRSRLAP